MDEGGKVVVRGVGRAVEDVQIGIGEVWKFVIIDNIIIDFFIIIDNIIIDRIFRIRHWTCREVGEIVWKNFEISIDQHAPSMPRIRIKQEESSE